MTLLVTSCIQHPSHEDEVKNGEGEKIARQYCNSCHVFPQPELLIKSSWKDYVLPRMGYMLGIYETSNERKALIESGKGGALVENRNIFPETPKIEKSDWERIKQYYLENAPLQIENQREREIETGLPIFETKIPDFKLSPPGTTLVKILKEGGYVIGDAHTKKIYQFSADGKLEKMANVKEGAVNLIERDNDLLITVMGSFSPTDNPSGFLMKLPLSPTERPKKIIDHLQRPVHAIDTDLNNDGIMDLVICEYAKWTGGLYWWKGMPNGSFERHPLLEQAGSIKSEIIDFNRDGLLDVIVLFGQGNEGISVFINQGNDTFKENKLIGFPPTYGSSYFELIDFDQDGDKDILYTCGDNADYKPQLKAYHGIYLFENKGDFKLEQKFFFQLNGAYKVALKDFDQDGDLDLAAISFFPDFENQQEESFIYAENSGNFQFAEKSFSEVKSGRWMVMDTGDIDQDGDLDIILGSLAFEVIPKGNYVDTWVKNGIPFIILENKLKSVQ